MKIIDKSILDIFFFLDLLLLFFGLIGSAITKGTIFETMFACGFLLGLLLLIIKFVKTNIKDFIMISIFYLAIFFILYTSGNIADFMQKHSNITIDVWMNFIGTLVGSIVTVIGAYLVTYMQIKATKTQDKQKKEEEELEKIKENALIVYYDLLLGLQDMKKMYISICTKDWVNLPRRMFFSDEWIKNVAAIRNAIYKKSVEENKDYVESLYSLYGELQTIKELIEKLDGISNHIELQVLIVKLSENLFNKNMVDELKVIYDYFSKYSDMYGDNADKNYRLIGDYIHKQYFSNEIKEKFYKYPKIKESRKKWIGEKLTRIDLDKDLSEGYRKILITLKNIEKETI